MGFLARWRRDLTMRMQLSTTTLVTAQAVALTAELEARRDTTVDRMRAVLEQVVVHPVERRIVGAGGPVSHTTKHEVAEVALLGRTELTAGATAAPHATMVVPGVAPSASGRLLSTSYFVWLHADLAGGKRESLPTMVDVRSSPGLYREREGRRETDGSGVDVRLAAHAFRPGDEIEGLVLVTPGDTYRAQVEVALVKRERWHWEGSRGFEAGHRGDVDRASAVAVDLVHGVQERVPLRLRVPDRACPTLITPEAMVTWTVEARLGDRRSATEVCVWSA